MISLKTQIRNDIYIVFKWDTASRGVATVSLGYSVCHHARVAFAVTPCRPQE